MRIRLIPIMLILGCELSWASTSTDSIKAISLQEVEVRSSYKKMKELSTSQPLEVVSPALLNEYFTGNLTKTLEHIPGVHSMDIGSAFSKPMIRGMGFNRVAVVENGIKQEGQQWGADHGLEIDAFGVARVSLRKGPSSLQYGSDAMGGAIEISPLPVPIQNQIFGEVSLLAKTVNADFGASIMLGIKKNDWYSKIRYSQQCFGDYQIPTDTVVYLTQRMPIANNRLKNTAGLERDISWYSDYCKGRYNANLLVSNAYQKVGFFAGAHGIPDASLLKDDGDSRNIDLPYSTVNHLKFILAQQYSWTNTIATWNVGYQDNHREEWSLFHTHYGNQDAPLVNPDKELEFRLRTLTSALHIKMVEMAHWEHGAGVDVQFQQNRISGYSFLLPRYNRFSTGAFWLSTYRANHRLSLSAGVRYDYGHIDISAYKDIYLVDYLRTQGYGEDMISSYQWRSNAVNRAFGDFSGSVGMVWTPRIDQIIKVNLGRCFRLPGANELASNGVHHGTFRHEQGDASLDSEQGWQLDLSYSFQHRNISISFTPFASWYSNYIFLRPTGEWSVLPHAGQIYRYSQAKALFAGFEAQVSLNFLHCFNYCISGEYVYTYNVDEHIPLPFSPPLSVRNTITWKAKSFDVYAEVHSIASQHRVSRNEDSTPGANLLNVGISATLSLLGTQVDIIASAQNLLNKKYYNHLSFYRKMEIPEPGRNFQLLIKIPLKINLK